MNLSIGKSSLPQGLNIESLTGVKLKAFSDTCLRHLFLTDPRSFYNLWNIQGSLQSASQTSEGFHGKATKYTRCYYLPALFRNINNSKSKEGRWIWAVEYQKFILNISMCFVEACLRCFLLGNTVFLVLPCESGAFLSKVPFKPQILETY